jgi:hypothetical protein
MDTILMICRSPVIYVDSLDPVLVTKLQKRRIDVRDKPTSGAAWEGKHDLTGLKKILVLDSFDSEYDIQYCTVVRHSASIFAFDDDDDTYD